MTTPTPTPEPGATPPAPTGEPPKTDPKPEGDGLGEAGKKALAEERAARKELERRLAALEPLTKLADALGVKPEPGQTSVETLTGQIAAMQKDLADERQARLREQVANDAKLPADLAARLVGTTRDELVADAAKLAALLPPASGTPGTPAPDPSQGPRSGTGELETQLAAAKTPQDRIRLKAAIAAQKSSK